MKRKIKNYFFEKGFVFIKFFDSYWGYDEEGYLSFGIESKSKSLLPLFETTRYLKLNFNAEYNVDKWFTQENIITLFQKDEQKIDTFIQLSLSFNKKFQ